MFYVSEKNWNKILGYAEEAYGTEKSEIGGMSVMVKDKDDDWELQDPVILEQEISAGNTVIDKDALAVYYTKKAGKMGKKDFRFCWWHSHHTMSAFWSGTDLTAIDEYSDGDFSFALVINLKQEYKFRVSVWSPVEAHQDVELEIMRPKRCNKHMRKEVENLCSKHTYVSPWKGSHHTSYGYQSKDQLTARKDPRQERLPFYGMDVERFDSPDRRTILSGETMNFADIVDEVDNIMSEVVEGTILYKEYKIQIDDLNTKLEKEDSFYKVKLLEESKIGDMLHMFPNELVVYRSSNIAVYDESFFYGGY